MSHGERVLFDQNADHYENEINDVLRGFGTGVDFFARGKATHLLREAERRFDDVASVRALDVGCGVGLMHPYLAGHFDRLCGVDVAENAIARAKATNDGVEYRTYDGTTLPLDDGSFDLVFAVCVMHHVSPDAWPAFVSEMFRVTAAGGVCAIFEHNPWNPLTRTAVSRCAFDADAVLLSSRRTRGLLAEAGFVDVGPRYLFFTPFRGAPFTWLDRALARLPLGAQYCVTGRRPA